MRLNARNAHEIGAYASSNGYHALAVEWLELAHQKASRDKNDHSIDEEIVKIVLKNIIQAVRTPELFLQEICKAGISKFQVI